MKNIFRAIVKNRIRIDLVSTDALPFQRINTHCLKAIDGNDSIHAEMFDADFLQKRYTIRINGAFYEVAMEREIDLLIEELGLSTDVAAASHELIAPMPGLIVEILAKPGSKVQKGDGLLVLEAMKMENTLTSPRDGVVKSVHLKVADAVDKGAVLIEFEDNEENT